MNALIKKMARVLPDSVYIKFKYRHHFGKFPNMKDPKTFNEKLQWLKLHDRNPQYIAMVDKYDAKKYIVDQIGEEYVIPSYGVWNTFEEINFDSLPDKFVLKTTHDCGGVVICKDKKTFDKDKAKTFLEKNLKNNYFWEGREWPYKNVKPRILAEAYMENAETGDLRDYKIFAFNGSAKALFIATDRQNETEETKFDFYDEKFNHLDIRNGHPNADFEIKKPVNFDKMISLAEKLSSGIPHLRVDFYEANGHLYVGELTFSHYSGFVPFDPPEWDLKFGEWIELPKQ